MNTKKTPCKIQSVFFVFNCLFHCYKPHVRCRKNLYLRSKLGLSYNKSFELVGYVGEKCHLSCSLDSYVELSLMKSASAGYTSGKDLCSLGNELLEFSNVLVINSVYLVLTEDANLLSSVHGTEGGTGRIVSFHLNSQTFLTHDFYITLPVVSHTESGRSVFFRREDCRRREFLQSLRMQRY